MTKRLTIQPVGKLAVEDLPEEAASTTELPAALVEAFERSSAEGLLVLAGECLHVELPPEFAFWRGFARRLFQAVCQLGEEGFPQWTATAPPPDDELAQLVDEAPPMRGLEYLDANVLRHLWTQLRDLVASQAAEFREGPAAYLHRINPVWQMLGRVTFHLAENKRDPERPFAFLATYSHRLSQRSRVAHLPLAEALKAYAAASERARLQALLAPVQRAAERSGLVKELLNSKALFAPQAWTIRQAYRFLQQAPQMEESGVVVRLPDWWTARRPPRPQVQVKLGERQPSELGLDSLLDFSVGIALEGEQLTDDERNQLLASTEGLVLLRGKWVEVDRQRLDQALGHWRQLQEQHAAGIDFIQGMRLLAGAGLDDESSAAEQVASWSHVVAGNWLTDALRQMRDPTGDGGCQPGRDLHAKLRPYQVEGVQWLWFVTELGLGGCLADDMGLGKTIQVIDLLLQRKRAKRQTGAEPPPPGLLVVPASLLGNWRQELTRFAPELRVLLLHRSECDEATLARMAENPQRESAGFDLVITTYGLVRRQTWLQQVRWSLVILDEAQAIKNPASAQSRSVKKLPAASRLVLTGTPVENHLGDLWSLFDFCCPGLLGSAAQFKKFIKRLNQQQDDQAFGALRRLVRPYILRRLKSDPLIVPDLPDKTEMRTECGLSKQQAALYERVVAELARQLRNAEGMKRRGLVLSTLMQLKQICNHPAQYLGGDRFPPAESGKFERLRLLAEPIAQRQERALVFTQFQSLTQPLSDYLATVFGRPGLVLHGGTPVRRRSELVRAFQVDNGPPFFVISLKAGGSGLNLTAASHVIHFDRWWNPAVENQATDRAFRIGQKRNVLVHKFVCRGTVEEQIDAMIRSKQDVAKRVLDQDGEKSLTEMNDDELLRFVALDIGRALTEE